MSQLALSHLAETTTRHLSFLETGRSRPGRELVLRLADALEIPLRERNALLAAAGFGAASPDLAYNSQEMRPIQRVVQQLLRQHEPFPAWVGGRGFRFYASNQGAEAIFPGMCAMSPEAIVDLWFGPSPFRDIVENWQDVVWVGLASLRREFIQSNDPALRALLQRAEKQAQSLTPPEPSMNPDLPVVCPRLRFGNQVVRTISTVLRFDTAVEVTASELRVELMFPADDESEAFFRAHAQR